MRERKNGTEKEYKVPINIREKPDTKTKKNSLIVGKNQVDEIEKKERQIIKLRIIHVLCRMEVRFLSKL